MYEAEERASLRLMWRVCERAGLQGAPKASFNLKTDKPIYKHGGVRDGWLAVWAKSPLLGRARARPAIYLRLI